MVARAFVLLLLVVAPACSPTVAIGDDDTAEGGEASEAQDACAAHTSAESCCSDSCNWLHPSDGFAGACVGDERNCGTRRKFECADQEVCYSRDVGPGRGCEVHYGLSINTVGVCIAAETCPDDGTCWPELPQ